MKKLISIILLIGITFVSIVFPQAVDDQKESKARAFVSQIGTGQKSKVEVKFRDNSKAKGYVGSTNADGFTLVAKSGSERTVRYADVDQIKKQSSGLTKGTWIAIVAGAAVVITIIALRPVFCDGGAGCNE
ncbi:MAG: hypothetical protein ACKVQW_08650 [Pyrinomonadaceae bacterium]